MVSSSQAKRASTHATPVPCQVKTLFCLERATPNVDSWSTVPTHKPSVKNWACAPLRPCTMARRTNIVYLAEMECTLAPLQFAPIGSSRNFALRPPVIHIVSFFDVGSSRDQPPHLLNRSKHRRIEKFPMSRHPVDLPARKINRPALLRHCPPGAGPNRLAGADTLDTLCIEGSRMKSRTTLTLRRGFSN